MSHSGPSRYEPQRDFEKAQHAASRRRFWMRITGRSNKLIAFEDLKEAMGFVSQRYRGTRPVELSKIIGSLGRSGDFDRIFLPTQRHSRVKWLSVDSAYLRGVALPPVSLYKVGESYFVVDGHHRVSVARQQGQAFIDAEVTEVQSRVPVTSNLTIEDLDDLAAYRDFLEQTKLDILRPEQDIRPTMPGDYARLLDHIRMHRYYVETDESREMPWAEAVAHWYDNVYLPVEQSIRRYNLLADFPGHSEADLYIWLIEHAYYLSENLGQSIAPWEVAKDFVHRFSHRPSRFLARLRARLLAFFIPESLEAGPRAGTWREERVEAHPAAHLFRDILVTVTGAETGWLALSQAAEIARNEGSTLRGLHIAENETPEEMEKGRQVLDEFRFRCQSLGVPYATHLVYGDVAEKIVERAQWTDMVVINQRRVNGRWAERPLGTIFQTVASQSARPILAVPGTQVTSPRRALLAYDGSPKAKEALFVFRHILCCWGIEGVIVTIESAQTDREMLDTAWQYVQSSGAQVSTRYEMGAADEVILRLVGEEQIDLLLMGGFGYQPLLKAFLGSTVDRILRVAWFPVLICR